MERKFKRGDLVKILEPPTADERARVYFTDTLQSNVSRTVGEIGRIVDVDEDATQNDPLRYYIKTRVQDHSLWYAEEYLRKAKTWEVKRYNRRKKVSRS